MVIDVLFAGVATADLARSLPWYETLWGRPPDIVVHEGEVMWQITGGGWLYLVVDPERAGRALVAVAMPDLDGTMEALAARGMELPDPEAVGEGGRKATLVDPEGNRVALIQVAHPST